MALLRLKNIELSFGAALLLDQVNLTINANERVCLIGRNGEGKSTLLKVIIGTILADQGERSVQNGVVITQLEQQVPSDIDGSVFDVVSSGLQETGTLLKKYHALSQLNDIENPDWLTQLEKTQQAIESRNGWQYKQQVDTTISRLSLNPEASFKTLSGGMKRRVLLAKALVQTPDILLLDEPTNHLDIESIVWLEDFLKNAQTSLVFITHDRAFLKSLATRIIELDRGQLTSWPGNYDNYLKRKEEQLEAEATENKLFDKKLAQEEVWIRQGIKARRTRNEGRVRALIKMREEHKQRRSQQGTVNLNLSQAERSGKVVVDARQIHFELDNGRVLVRNFSTLIQRGDKIGLIGPNGVGKSTLLNILLGKLSATSQEKLKLGTNLQVAYFDQMRAQLDPEKNVRDNLDQGKDQLMINGKPRHIVSYLQDFLFSPERIHSPVSSLSGGEQNRLLLAKLFLKAANVLVLDEPTNDLDIETLELLEERLLQFEGTLLLVSHDRHFLNNIVTSCLAFEGNGVINEYIGGYDDWLRQTQSDKKHTVSKSMLEKGIESPSLATDKSQEKIKKRKKLSYKNQRELDALPALLEQLESQIDELQTQFSQADFYKQSPELIAESQERHSQLEEELEAAYARWEQLEEAAG